MDSNKYNGMSEAAVEYFEANKNWVEDYEPYCGLTLECETIGVWVAIFVDGKRVFHPVYADLLLGEVLCDPVDAESPSILRGRVEAYLVYEKEVIDGEEVPDEAAADEDQSVAETVPAQS